MHTFTLLSAGSKVNQLDCDVVVVALIRALSHHDVLWLQVSVAPLLMQIGQDLHKTVLAGQHHRASNGPTLY